MIKRRGFLGSLMAVLAVGTTVKAKPVPRVNPKAKTKSINPLTVIARDAAYALEKALGPCVLMGNANQFQVGQTMRYVDFSPVRKHEAKVLRACINQLVADVKRTRLRRFWIPNDDWGGSQRSATAWSTKSGVAVQVVEVYDIATDQMFGRLRVIGAPLPKAKA